MCQLQTCSEPITDKKPEAPWVDVFVAKAIKVAVTLLPSPQLHDSPSYFLGGGPGSTQGLLMKRQRKS